MMRDWTDDEREQAKAAIVAGLSEGIPLRQLCRENDALPRARTVSDWRKADPAFDVAFLAARDEGFDAIAEQCLEIADDGRRDYTVDEEGGQAVNHDHIQRAKLRVDTRLKLLAKWDPRRYGDRQAIEHSGQIGLEQIVAGDS